MLKVEIAISLKIGFRIGFCPRLKPPVNGPVGSVNGCTANAVSVLLQERTHAISFFDRVAFFEEWITKKTHKIDRKSTRLNSSHSQISYAVFCLKKKKKKK